jgi:hypothetical protein
LVGVEIPPPAIYGVDAASFHFDFRIIVCPYTVIVFTFTYMRIGITIIVASDGVDVYF